jgi:hypothetical protein
MIGQNENSGRMLIISNRVTSYQRFSRSPARTPAAR